ncbi:MAG: DNA polymerase Y family protein [Planctomycetes bacterium]|nr:DNA polymerase Y family protein [Planctomycetota bacterium]
MDRMACVDLPAFPLQLLLRRHPEWRDGPVVVVESDRPQARVLWTNESARRRRIRTGMRYAAALSLAGDLRAGVVPAAAIERTSRALIRQLQRFSPDVEAAGAEPGLYWLNATGLERLFGSLARWACGLHAALERWRFEAVVVVGFGKFATAAVARASRGIVVFPTAEVERAAARRVPLDRVGLDPRVRDDLEKLAVRTVGDFADLPPEGIARRFGTSAARLHREARGEEAPFVPERPAPPLRHAVHLDYAERDALRLEVLVDHLLALLRKDLAARGLALGELRMVLRHARGDLREEVVRPAAPTLDAGQWRELVRLRLESVRLEDGVVEVAVEGEGQAATPEQLELFVEEVRRQRQAAERALARIQARFGNDTVVRARLEEAHLPEAQFAWESLARLGEARPRAVRDGVLVRRLLARPVPLPARARHEPDGWMLRGLAEGPVVRIHGPYLVSGGWWARRVHREYHFAETRRGDLLWVFYDRVRRRWFLHGRVE